MTAGKLYLTEDELELLKTNYNERSKAFYVPRTVDASDVGHIRPVITERNLIETHYILSYYESDNYSRVYFDHYQDGAEKSAHLDVWVVSDGVIQDIEDEVESLFDSVYSDEVLAAFFKKKAEELTNNE